MLPWDAYNGLADACEAFDLAAVLLRVRAVVDILVLNDKAFTCEEPKVDLTELRNIGIAAALNGNKSATVVYTVRGCQYIFKRCWKENNERLGIQIDHRIPKRA